MKLLSIALILLCGHFAIAQDSLSYTYATLESDLTDNILTVEYSNGFKEDLLQKIQPSKSDFTSHHQLEFRCFEYMNANGYELVSSNFYLNRGYVGIEYRHIEYVFKRKRKL